MSSDEGKKETREPTGENSELSSKCIVYVIGPTFARDFRFVIMMSCDDVK